jgi:predicted DNA-binding transcriptional regulator YafY
MTERARRMAKKATQDSATTVTAERSRRLFRLLKLLSAGPQSRAGLVRRLRLGVRGFYRDLEVLRSVNILIQLSKGKYFLEEEADKAIDRLPFPDPLLSLGEARQLAKGRGAANKRLRELLEQIEK